MMVAELFILPTNMERVKARHDEYDPATKNTRTKVVETLCNED